MCEKKTRIILSVSGLSDRKGLPITVMGNTLKGSGSGKYEELKFGPEVYPTYIDVHKTGNIQTF